MKLRPALAALLLASCGTPVDPDGAFATAVHPVLIARCGCHDQADGPGGGVSSKTGPGDFADDNTSVAYDSAVLWLNPGDPDDSLLYTELLPDSDGEPSMPPLSLEPIPQEDRDAVRDWIADGAAAE